MWNNREESMNFRNQNLNFNFVSQRNPFTPNMILPPPNNYVRQFFHEESRERKCVDNTGHSNISSGVIESSQGNIGNMLPRNCNTQHNLSYTPVNTNSQYGEHQFYNIGSSQALQAKNESINNNPCGNFPPFHLEKSHFPCNQNFGSTETSQVELQLENAKDIGRKNNSKLCNPYLYPYPFKNIQSNVGSFERNLSRNETVEGKKLDHVTTLEPQIRIPHDESPIKETTEDNKGKETQAIFQYNGNTQTNCGSSNPNPILYGKTNHVEDTIQSTPQMLMHTDKVSNGVETKQLKKSEESNTDSTIKKSIEGNSISNENVIPDKPIEPAGKPSLLLAEKLWEGTIQLSTSTIVSAVAFFKSGEKALDIKWPEHLETKGKVRLQAFEKYIQELPRSRNRTLMLISLCWKPGTSEAGLAGMKEIAKVFKEKERVGYAEISQGFDLYVCPRTETIITILAKHGFFKGMAVLEDDQDSLIGCVIWRRSNNTPSNSVPKTVDKKISPVSSVQESNSPESQEDELESKQKKADSAALQETSKEPEFPKPFQEQKQEINGFRSFRNFSFDPSSFTYVGAHAPIKVQPSVLVPPLPNQTNGDLTKVPSAVIKKLEPHLKIKNGDDGDLPEFDFDYACGVKRSPTTTAVSPLINHQTLVTEVKTEQKSIPTPIKRPIHIAEASDTKYGHPNSLPNSNISKKSRWNNDDDDDDDDDMPEWHPPEMENQNVNNKDVHRLEMLGKAIEAPASTLHSYHIRNQSNVVKPSLKNATEVPLMPPPPPPPPQFGFVHGSRKPPANGFIINEFRSPAAADFSYGNRNFDVSRQWKRP